MVVDNCTFYNNTGNFSSALYVFVSLPAKIYYNVTLNPNWRFVNNTFHDNQPFETINLLRLETCYGSSNVGSPYKCSANYCNHHSPPHA